MKHSNDKTHTITEGVNGSGVKIWVLITTQGERVLNLERFSTEAEALSWAKWA